MTDRSFAATFKGDEVSGFVIELVPRRDIETLLGQKVVMVVKDGATRDQVDKLQASINLLGVDIRISDGDDPS